MPEVVVKIEGLDKVVAALRALPPEMGSKGGGPIRGALFAAAKVFKEEARIRAPVGDDTPSPGRLRDNIITVRGRNNRHGVAESYMVTVRTGRRGKGALGALARAYSNRDAWYWRFVEFGTNKMPAQPFLRPAFETKKHEALAVFRTQLSRLVSLAERRARRKAGG
jgi:HK97 gp10 family phage protein